MIVTVACTHERRVVFMNAENMKERAPKPKMMVNVTSHFAGQQRHSNPKTGNRASRKFLDEASRNSL